MHRAILNLDQVAEYLGVSKVYVRRQIWRKAWPHIRLGRVVRMAVEDVDRILKASRVPADPLRAAPGALAGHEVAEDLDRIVANLEKKGTRRGR